MLSASLNKTFLSLDIDEVLINYARAFVSPSSVVIRACHFRGSRLVAEAEASTAIIAATVIVL